MCTAASLRSGGLFFGRTLDNCKSYGEEVVFSPRSMPLWRGGGEHYAMLGMATVRGGYPLYYDAMNEKGLCMAGLNLTESAGYGAPVPGAVNVAQHELIAYILGTCASVDDAERALGRVNLTGESFAPGMPPAALHWMISDGRRDVVAECVGGKMNVYKNDAGVLANEPVFPAQMFNLRGHMSLSAEEPRNALCPALGLKPYGFGMGAIGLPGDYSSPSRFVRAAFVRNNCSPAAGGGQSALFEVLGSVRVPRGCCRTAGGEAYTMYSCCMCAARLTYVWTTDCVGAPRAVRLRPRCADMLVYPSGLT